ncbi:MAG: choice-of-anchor C family protein, partial [Casimicrobiaceae bacterium]
MKRILSALFALMCAASASAAPFQNGGFEIGGSASCGAFDNLPAGSSVIPGWMVSVGNIDWAGPCNWTSQEGSHSLDLIGGSTTIGGIQQTFDTVSGATYQVTFYLAGNPSPLFPPAIKPLQVTVDGTVYGNYTFDTSSTSSAAMGWVPKTFQFVASASTSTIDFRSAVGSSSFAGAALDNVSIAQISSGSAAPWTGTALSVTNQGTPIGSSPTVVSDGTTGPAVFTYATVNSFCCHTGDWTFETTAAATGPVTLNWSYSGYHGTCQAVVTLTPYAKNNGGTTFGAPVYSAADNCTGQPPSGGFGMEGQITLVADAGYAYGFLMHASNFDLNGGVQGRLTVTTGTSPTTTTLQSSANPSLTGSTVDFTATVAGNVPTGTMMFTRETRVLPQGPVVLGCEAVPLAGGSAVCSTNFLFPGDSIVALYSGDLVNAGSISTTLIQQVVNAPVATTLIRALPMGSPVIPPFPPLIGRADGLPNTPITVRLFSGTTCTNGVLGGAAQIGPDASVTTDANGYFGTAQQGTQGQFVAIGLVSPQVTPLSACVVSAADNDTW